MLEGKRIRITKGFDKGKTGMSTYSNAYTHMHAHTHTQVHTYTHAHVHTYTHTHTFTHTHTNTHTHTHIHTRTHTYTHTHTHTHTHTYAYPHTHACTHMHTYAQTHTRSYYAHPFVCAVHQTCANSERGYVCEREGGRERERPLTQTLLYTHTRPQVYAFCKNATLKYLHTYTLRI